MCVIGMREKECMGVCRGGYGDVVFNCGWDIFGVPESL